MKRITRSLRRNFLAGLLVTVPFGFTVFILFKLGKWIIGLISAAPAKFLIKPLSELHPLLFQVLTFAIGLIGTLLVILIVGAITRNYIGLVTGVPQYTESGKRLLGIFLPTAFNPTGGYYFMIPEDEVKELPISVEDAFRIIISGGLASNQIGTAKPGKEDDKTV